MVVDKKVLLEDKRKKAVIKIALKLMKTSKSGFPRILDFAREHVNRNLLRSLFGNHTDFEAFMCKTYPEEYSACISTVENERRRDDLLRNTLKCVMDLGRYPTAPELERAAEITPSVLKYHFGSMTGLFKQLSENYDHILKKQLFSSVEFTDKRMTDTLKRLSDTDLYLITTTVSGCRVHPDMLESVKAWEKASEGACIFQPIADPARPRSGQGMYFDPVLRNEAVIFEDIQLNAGVHILSVLNSAKRINPHDAAIRYADGDKLSFIASPKQRLTPLSGLNDYPGYLASTGAITVADYTTELYMSNALAYEAAKFHQYGGMIVKVLGDKRYAFTNITFNEEDGSFVHLGQRYGGDGARVGVDYIAAGDLHVPTQDNQALNVLINTIEHLKPTSIYLHDVLSCVSINPFDANRPFAAYANQMDTGIKTLEEEGAALVDTLGFIYSRMLLNGKREHKIYIVASNHEEFIRYYLESGRYLKDPTNLRICVKLSEALVTNPDCNLLQKLFQLCGGKNKDIVFLSGNASHKRLGTELALHGHKGTRGKRNPSLKAIHTAVGSSVVGHGHMSEIYNTSMRVGTMEYTGKDRPRYARGGFSDWSQSIVVGYEDGSKQLFHSHNLDFLTLDINK